MCWLTWWQVLVVLIYCGFSPVTTCVLADMVAGVGCPYLLWVFSCDNMCVGCHGGRCLLSLFIVGFLLLQHVCWLTWWQVLVVLIYCGFSPVTTCVLADMVAGVGWL